MSGLPPRLVTDDGDEPLPSRESNRRRMRMEAPPSGGLEPPRLNPAPPPPPPVNRKEVGSPSPSVFDGFPPAPALAPAASLHVIESVQPEAAATPAISAGTASDEFLERIGLKEKDVKKVLNLHDLCLKIASDARIQHNRNSALYRTELNNLEMQIAQLEKTRAAEAAAREDETRVAYEAALLEEVSLYEYYNMAENSIELKLELDEIAARRKDLNRTLKAVRYSTRFVFNGSQKEGEKVAKNMAKLMLSAYNAEVENAIMTSARTQKLTVALVRVDKSFESIKTLGALMECYVTDDYHALRKKEIVLTFKYKEILALEKEESAREKALMREEERELKEIKREADRLEREAKSAEAKHQKLIESLEAERLERVAELERARVAGLEKEQERLMTVLSMLDEQNAAELEKYEEEMHNLEDAKADTETRIANRRAGYVYIISNVGSFGEDVVKIGLTRRVNPEDRVKELGDASVPFTFDTHALHYSDDAVTLETALHQRFASRAVNRVNMRKEFFRVTPSEVMEVMSELSNGTLIQFDLSQAEPEYLRTRDILEQEAREALTSERLQRV